MHYNAAKEISIHPPLAGWDTPFLRLRIFRQYFNPPTPCGVGRLIVSVNHRESRPISIHPPLAGWDKNSRSISAARENFNPPTPCGVGHWNMKPPAKNTYFNPPTPCGVGRRSDRGSTQTEKHFNPPTPCGVGPAGEFKLLVPFTFQSTHPLRGGTSGRSTIRFPDPISIHPPLAGWDRTGVRAYQGITEFQSTHPLRGGTVFGYAAFARNRNFNPPTPCGVGHDATVLTEIGYIFQSTHPLRGGTEIFWTKTETYLDFNPPTPCGVGQQKHTGKFLLFYAEPIESMGFNKYTSVFRFYKAFLPSFSPKIAVRTPRLYAGHFPFARLNKQHPFGFI